MSELQEISDRIDALARLEIGKPILDGYGQRTHPTDAAEACAYLHDLWGRLRRTLWSAPYQQWARELQERCRVTIDQISEAHDFMPVGPPARFPAFTDSAGNFHTAID